MHPVDLSLVLLSLWNPSKVLNRGVFLNIIHIGWFYVSLNAICRWIKCIKKINFLKNYALNSMVDPIQTCVKPPDTDGMTFRNGNEGGGSGLLWPEPKPIDWFTTHTQPAP